MILEDQTDLQAGSQASYLGSAHQKAQVGPVFAVPSALMMTGRRTFLVLGTVFLLLAAFRSCGAIEGGSPTQPIREVMQIFAIAGVGFMIAAVAMAIVEQRPDDSPHRGLNSGMIRKTPFSGQWPRRSVRYVWRHTSATSP